MKNTLSLKKFLGLYALLLLLIPGVVLVSGSNTRIGDLRSQAAPNSATVTFWPVQANLITNQKYDFELKIDPTLKPPSLDLVLSFDPKVIEVSTESPIPGDMFEIYQARFADNLKGLVGISGKGELRSGVKFATLKVTTKSSGDPKFTVNYVNGNNMEVKVNLPKYIVE